MDQRLRPSSLVPTGFAIESSAIEGERVTLRVRAVTTGCVCPCCGAFSRRVQSRYWRRVADLPLAGRSLDLVVMMRRFWCDAVLCVRKIFAERFADGVLAPWARRTERLDHIVHHLGLALGGRPASGIARRLMLPVSNDTLLRVVRSRIIDLGFLAPDILTALAEGTAPVELTANRLKAIREIPIDWPSQRHVLGFSATA